MIEGIYEQLITQLVHSKINELDQDKFYINTTKIDKEEASLLLSKHLSETIRRALSSIHGENQIERQIEIANKIIHLLKDELSNKGTKDELRENIIGVEGRILNAVFSRINADYSDPDLYLKEIVPYTRLTHSELFTGGNVGLSLESELKKEIQSSNKIDLLVSFIKFKGIIILEKELSEFVRRGGQLRVITTTYMGASDYKAIQLLSKLENTTVKISYNSSKERLHAKAYLFYRNTGFHTGYIGSSNFSRSALTDGLEWNVKITTKEIPHIINKFQKTFDSYWESADFEKFDDSLHSEKLITSLKQGKQSPYSNSNLSFFEIKPFPFQEEILEKLEVEREIHQRFRNLIVAATGTGKTVISAFDFKRFKLKKPASKLLFLAHRKEILDQSLYTFRGILRDNNFGELWGDGNEPTNYQNVFATVQTLNNRLNDLTLSPDYYDFIIIDECHHSTASSYRNIIEHFRPQVLLGLTATPERMDGGNILEDFHHRTAAEIRLPEALNRKLLCPFQYFGVSDSMDLSQAKWDKGKYSVSELTSLYTSNDRRVSEIIHALNKYTKDINDVIALGFCVSIEHAKYMTSKFALAGLKANFLVGSDNDVKRSEIRNQLTQKKINFLFVVDIFNEGIDIPEIDTVLFLRPTESLTVFLQQLGRGLRLAENKDCLTVLDFVGNARPEYNFENKFRALIGKTSSPVSKEIADNFPHLPLGCSIILEKKAKDVILENINKAASWNQNKLISKIQHFQNNFNVPLTLRNFIELHNIPLQIIYKKQCWSRLLHSAGVLKDFDSINEKIIRSAISNKWLSTNSSSYFNFILQLAKKNFQITVADFNESEKLMLMMLYYDVWPKDGNFNNLEEGIKSIGKNETLVSEIIEVLEILSDRVDFMEYSIELPFNQPLKVHARYTRDQILAAFQLSTFEKKNPSREGVAENSDLNTELLFINLIKSEENFSPTTMYNDFAISELLFHWQSQNSAGPETKKGLSYIHHRKIKKKILLFIREQKNDEFGNTRAYVFAGEANLNDHHGSKPMNITWKLETPLPQFLWKDAAKMLAG